MDPQQQYYQQAAGGQAAPYQSFQGAPPAGQPPYQQPSYYQYAAQQPPQGHFQSQPYHAQAHDQFYAAQGQYPPSPAAATAAAAYGHQQGVAFAQQPFQQVPFGQQQAQQPVPFGGQQQQTPQPAPYGQQQHPPQQPLYGQQPPSPQPPFSQQHSSYGQQQPPPSPYGQQQPPPSPYAQQQPPQTPFNQQASPQAPFAQQASPQTPYGQQHPPQTPFTQQSPSQPLYAQQPPQQPSYAQQAPEVVFELPAQVPQQYAVPQQQWQQPSQPAPASPNPIYPPTPASAGYDPAQKSWAQHVDTASDVEILRKAMKGVGCDERALIRVLTQAKYNNPWAMAQLVHDYNSRFMRELAKDIEDETRGDFETCLLALVNGPLKNDAVILKKALVRAGTDEDALNDVLLNRSNADIKAIIAEYKRLRGHELAVDIRDDVGDDMFRLYSMVLSATRTEDAAPVNAVDIDQKVTEVQRATEGTIGANAVAVAQIFVNCNNAQLKALVDSYQQKYHHSLHEVIEKEFRGDMEDALLYMLSQGANRAYADAARLREPLQKTIRKDRLFINRVVSLYWDRNRLQEAKDAYKRRYGVPLSKDVKDYLKGDYETFILALIADK